MNTEKSWDEVNVGKRIGTNLRQFRMNKGMSLESLANQIEVSKLTLIKIESGEANPTLSVIWKIANGLNIPISALLSIESNVSIARKKDGLKLSSSNDMLVVEPLFNSHSLLEFYRGYLKPEGEYVSEPHPLGVVEFVTVMSGQLTVDIGGDIYHLDEHDSIRFKGDLSHKYINTSSSVTILHFVISYNNI